MEELDILFLGGLYPKDMYDEIHKKSLKGMQNAANTLQWNIVEGLDANLSKPINILNLMFVGSYPKKYKDIIVRSFDFKHVEGAKDYNVGHFNLTGIKQLMLGSVIKRPLKRWLLNKDHKKKILIIYSAQPFFLEAAEYAKRINKDISICLIVPDLPAYMGLDSSNNKLKDVYKNYGVKKVKDNIIWIDKFVFLTESMAKYFKTEKPYIVIEGMVSSKQYSFKEHKQEDIKTILYTGTLTKKYGIMDLVNAFRNIKKENYKLIICGDGEAKEEVRSFALEDSRIEFKGLVSSEEVKNIQQKATILVNPRKNNEEYTKFSFPSKLMEYLVSGKPVVCYKLDGIPKEYNDYLIYIEDDSIKTMSNKLVEICEKDSLELNKIGRRNREFVLDMKNNIYQTKKIVDMLVED